MGVSLPVWWRRVRWVRTTLLLSLGLILVVVGVPACHLARTWWGDRDERRPPRAGAVDDASRMNETAVAEEWNIPTDPRAAETQLGELLRQARARHLPIAIAGSRHSMGGHTIFPGGIALNMLPFDALQVDETRRLLMAGAGARWSQVVPFLDQRGLSVEVMQSNNDFSVGGSVSVNCHGWQPDHGPIASTVESFRLLKADGTIVRCSRSENSELFRLALGGYGLFGVILDVNLRVVVNEAYRPEVHLVASDRYVQLFREQVSSRADAGLAYGRLCVTPGDKTFLREGLLTVFRRSPGEKPPPLADPGYRSLRRALFRGEVGSSYGKSLRWSVEKKVSQQLVHKVFSRNQLLNESASVLQEHGKDRTDILHEYFVPPKRLEPFLARLRKIIPQHGGDLLNVTLRNVKPDRDTFLCYAPEEMFGLVLLFSQPRTEEGERKMEAMTRALIDAALELGGRYYLPYRLHATPDQFQRAYPQARAFFASKRQLDPDELFQNQFYRKYGAPR